MINFKLYIIIIILTGLSGCQSLLPTAKGLPELQLSISQITQATSTQQQVEMIWREQSFSFLLYQQQQAQQLHVIAMTFSGQVLFELHYDGKKINVLQRYSALKNLPLDFLMRDIWWATLPSSQLQSALTSLNYQLIEQENSRQILNDQQQTRLSVQRETQKTLIDNHVIPYRLILSTTQEQFLLDHE
ncbi:DUF3261 domain-containing protein [Moraxella sp. ZY210820]|uniref:DUF3261 domain-containing protein n=1 Tax=unclassified Moraxella TaxID=2685852 RepID=UPI0027308BB0|nr:DUF3261 domain-containing protein [Moraxella sp. ZY210820]WLF84139.1 DUF3261 domain-containing protein [Moraxella sp. ZY210820]